QSVAAVQDGEPPKLQDVAEVKTGAALKLLDASFNGQPAVVLMINKQPDVDTPTVTQAVEAVMNSLQSTFPADVRVQRTFRQSNFIDSAIGNVSGSLIQGIIIVSVIMLLFLMNWRTAIITLSAIPLSLLIGLMFMKAFGLGINTMTLGGLVVAIGSVVDDAPPGYGKLLSRFTAESNPRKPQPPLSRLSGL
ncbi:efflux RND transporter permease subunit, partial [Limnospira platensis]